MGGEKGFLRAQASWKANEPWKTASSPCHLLDNSPPCLQGVCVSGRERGRESSGGGLCEPRGEVRAQLSSEQGPFPCVSVSLPFPLLSELSWALLPHPAPTSWYRGLVHMGSSPQPLLGKLVPLLPEVCVCVVRVAMLSPLQLQAATVPMVLHGNLTFLSNSLIPTSVTDLPGDQEVVLSP